MLLQHKNAVIYGAGGAIGGAVARAFAREGARVFLAGRTMGPIDAVAREISVAGGVAETAYVDALDEQAVEQHIGTVAEKTEGIDVSFNAIGFREVQGTPLVDLSLEDFTFPIMTWTRTLFLTARAAARRMVKRRSGVILTLSAPPGLATPLVGGFEAACAAIQGLSRTLAGELGPHGIRVVCLQPDAIPESAALQETFAQHAKATRMTREAFQALQEGGTLLRRLPTLAEVANVAAFMASDRASAMTGTVVNLTCGSIVD
ncbi:MAG: SDR family NAD(P)-dependent oxidoreductase [Candidatus Entotheonellia bacterium]